jgi:hypothetical protein
MLLSAWFHVGNQEVRDAGGGGTIYRYNPFDPNTSSIWR